MYLHIKKWRGAWHFSINYRAYQFQGVVKTKKEAYKLISMTVGNVFRKG